MEMISSIFRYLTPFVYWMLILFWLFIFSFYIRRIRKKKYNDLLLRTLFVILSIDSLRTLFESTYFGFWYTSLSGLIPISIYNFLAQPQIVFFPKITNLVVSIIIITILIRKWIPEEDQRLMQMKSDILTFETAFNQTPMSIVITDVDGIIKYVNRKTCELTGYSDIELKGRNPRIFSSGMTKPETYENLWSTITDGKEWKGFFQNMKKNGQYYWEDATISPMFNDAGIITHFIATKEDITEKLKIQEQLQHRNKMDAIGQLAGGIAHDFNNVLSGIMSSAQLLKLKNRDLSDRSLKYIDIILESSERAADLSNRLLVFSSKKNTTSTSLDIHTVINDVFNILKSTIDKKIELVLDLVADEHFIVGNNSELHNAILNLCINASHAMPDGGKIKILTGNSWLDAHFCNKAILEISEGMYCWVEISDEGTGISKENLERIFEPFFTTKNVGEGSGLGLTAVYKMAENHHGTVDVESVLCEGTSFRIYLPITTDHSFKRREVLDSEFRIIDSEGKHILIVDDEETNQIVIGDIVRALGFNVILASNGLEALDLVIQNDISFIILDMIMPQMSGYETFVELRKRDSNCKIIVSTGYSDSQEIKKMEEMGLSGVLHKPFKIEELSEVLKRESGS